MGGKMSEYERLSLELLWLIAKGQLMLIKAADSSDIAANVIHHDNHLNAMKTRIEKWAGSEWAAELESLRHEQTKISDRMTTLAKQVGEMSDSVTN
jgi:hypothetical protein